MLDCSCVNGVGGSEKYSDMFAKEVRTLQTWKMIWPLTMNLHSFTAVVFRMKRSLQRSKYYSFFILFYQVS